MTNEEHLSEMARDPLASVAISHIETFELTSLGFTRLLQRLLQRIIRFRGQHNANKTDCEESKGVGASSQ